MKEYKDQLNRIESKIDKMDERQDKVDVHLAEYNAQLKIHIKRSEMLEDHLKPVMQHVDMMRGAGKALGIISLGLGLILTILKLTGKL